MAGRLKAYEEWIKYEIGKFESQWKLMFHKAEYSNNGYPSYTPRGQGRGGSSLRVRGQSQEAGGRGTDQNQTEG